MPDATPNLSLPLLAASQAQKHVTHNEALALIDALVQLAVETMTQAAPPADLVEGARYVVPAGATGAWTGKAGTIAIVAGGGWVFQPVRAGFVVFDRAQGKLMLFDGTEWRDTAGGGDGGAGGGGGTGGGGGPVTFPSSLDRLGINATATDVQRLAVQSRGAFFSHDDSGSHQLQVNRQDAANTGSLVFSTGWSGRAETGLAGSDDWRVKVSADGAAWRDALVAEASTGRVRFPQGLTQLQRPALSASSDIHLVSPGVTAIADFAVTAGRLYAAPFIAPQRRTFERVAMRVTLAAAGQARLGLYDDAGDCRPGALIADLGTMDTGTTGLKTLPMARDLDDRTYWIAAVFQAAPRVMGQQGAVLGVSAAATLASTVAVCGLYRALPFGALPANESAAAYLPATSMIGCPLFYIR